VNTCGWIEGLGADLLIQLGINLRTAAPGLNDLAVVHLNSTQKDSTDLITLFKKNKAIRPTMV
jgi:hypothetical protein